MRIITADEMGLVKVMRVETGECLAVSAGEQTRARAVKRLCHGRSLDSKCKPDFGRIHVARTAGVVEAWDISYSKQQESSQECCKLELRQTVDCPSDPLALSCIRQSSPADKGSRIVTCNEEGLVQVHSSPLSSSTHDGNGDITKPTSLSIQGPVSSVLVSETGDKGGTTLASGGRENDLKTWDVQTAQCTWKAKNVPHDFLDLRQPVWITSICSLSPENGLQHMVTGTAYHQVRLYDTRANKRPTHSLDAFDHGVTTMAVAPSGQEVVVADTAGMVSTLDLRQLRWGRKFRGPAGSVRGLAFHPTLPRLACVGLDRMAWVYDSRSAQLKFKIYLKQRLNAVLFDEEGAVRSGSSGDGERHKSGVDGTGGEESGSDQGWGSGEEYEMDNQSSECSDDEGRDADGEDLRLGAKRGKGETGKKVARRKGEAINQAAGASGSEELDDEEEEDDDDNDDAEGDFDADGDEASDEESADSAEGDENKDDEEGEEEEGEDEAEHSSRFKRQVSRNRVPRNSKKWKRG